MAKILSKEGEERTKKALERLRMMPFPDAVFENIHTGQNDLERFPEQQQDIAKMLVANLFQAVISHPDFPNPSEYLIMVLSFVVLYGRVPEKHELDGFDVASVRDYFIKKYPEDVLGKE